MALDVGRADLYNRFVKRKNLFVAIGLLLSVFLIGGILYSNKATPQPVEIVGTTVPAPPVLDRDEIAQGKDLYILHCAACHGVNLEGQADWKTPLPDGSLKPPPHDDSGHTWHHADFQLLEIIAKGGSIYDGVMPGFADQLTEEQATSILTYLKSEWGTESREYQWWVTNTYPTPAPGSK
jgi:mono/diheme cytochrome c family protein